MRVQGKLRVWTQWGCFLCRIGSWWRSRSWARSKQQTLLSPRRRAPSWSRPSIVQSTEKGNLSWKSSRLTWCASCIILSLKTLAEVTTVPNSWRTSLMSFVSWAKTQKLLFYLKAMCHLLGLCCDQIPHSTNKFWLPMVRFSKKLVDAGRDDRVQPFCCEHMVRLMKMKDEDWLLFCLIVANTW